MTTFYYRCFLDQLAAEMHDAAARAVPRVVDDDADPPWRGEFTVEVLLLDEKPAVPALPSIVVRRDWAGRGGVPVELCDSYLSPSGNWHATFAWSAE